MKNRLWTRNYTLLMTATTLGCIGGIAGGYALSLLVFDETRSTLASAIVLAIQIVPGFLMPLLLAPWMDRMPRKPFLVGGDVLNGVLYAGAGVYLLLFRFSYVGYLCFSLLLATLSSFDQLNEEGQQKAVDYVDDLVLTGRYKKCAALGLGTKEA